jgi:uncharacterized membrane protein
MLAAALLAPLLAHAAAATKAQDLPLFRSLKPNLSAEEEKRLRKAFDSTKSHEATITMDALDCQEARCAHLLRRDTLDGSIVSSFPQTVRLAQGAQGMVIEEIGR